LPFQELLPDELQKVIAPLRIVSMETARCWSKGFNGAHHGN
jgi:hypothetical protein